MSRKKPLGSKYPPYPPCSCEICRAYCRRPGWWTVEEAAAALDAGYGTRMMLEMGPGNAFGVLSPAFRGAEQGFATSQYAKDGCTFLQNERCELHSTSFQPLECRFCHHDRPGKGQRCHADIEKQWNSAAGRALVLRWSNETHFWKQLAQAHDP
jgi:hypothetical protein